MAKKILLLSDALIPLAGQPVTGEGLRAWSVGEGLRALGFQVTYALPGAKLAALEDTHAPEGTHLFAEDALGAVVEAAAPDVLVFAQWPLLASYHGPDLPIALDCAAPRAIRADFLGARSADNTARKVEALRKADWVCCAGEAQRSYFQAWQHLAGVEPDVQPLAVVPPALSSDLPEPAKGEVLTAAYGGVLWPWLEPLPALRVLANLIESRGRLRIFVQEPGDPTLPPGAWPPPERNALQRRIRDGDHIAWEGLAAHERWSTELQGAHLAFDLHQANAERALASAMRTIEYLWHGVPVVHARQSPLVPYIHQYHAGWVGDPANTDGLRRVLTRVLDTPELLERASQNAQQLVRDHFTWDKAVGPLAAFCSAPKKRSRRDAPVAFPRTAAPVEAPQESPPASAAADSADAEALHARIAELEQTIGQMKEEHAEALRERDAKIEQVHTQINSLMPGDVSPDTETADPSEDKEAALRARVTALEEEKDTLEARLAELLEAAEAAQAPEAVQPPPAEAADPAELAIVRAQCETLAADKEVLRAQLSELIAEYDQVVEAQRAGYDLTETRNALSEELALVTRERDNLQRENETLQATLGQLQETAAQQAQQEEAKRATAAEEEMAALRQALATVQHERDEVQERFEAADLARTELEQVVAEQGEKLAQLDAQPAAEAGTAGEEAPPATPDGAAGGNLPDQVTRLSEELTQAQDAQNNLTETLEQLEAELNRANEQASEAEVARRAAEERAAALEAETAQLRERAAALEAETAQLREHAAALEEPVSGSPPPEWEEERGVMQARIDRLTQQLDQMQAARDALADQLEKAETAPSTPEETPADTPTAEEYAALREQVDAVTERLQEAESQRDAGAAEAATAREEQERLANELATAREEQERLA
ncbi:MAG: hypothetical protein ACLFTT_18815, partial [Candidatus Hydrogenedentota bacterium]